MPDVPDLGLGPFKVQLGGVGRGVDV